MKKILLSVACFLAFINADAQKDLSSLVNPFIGTGGHGHTYPGASMPFGMMQLSPDTRMADWDGSSGYHYSDSVIYGFSHTHLSGTGIPDYCDILLMPFTGQINWNQQQYRSGFSHANEKASPGYYEVLLNKGNIKVQLTTSYRSGMHQYRFPSSQKTGKLLIDLRHRDQVLDASLEKLNAYEVRGYRRSRSWAQDQTVYFHIKFDKPIAASVIALDDKPATGSKQQGKNLKAAFTFALDASHLLHCKIGISGVSMDGARQNLESEIKDWDFNKVKNLAKAAWNKELDKIEIRGGTLDQQTVFYTALYHTFLVPNIFQDVDGQYRGTDLKVHQAGKDFTNYTVFSLWDTYRAYHPLMSIINTKRTGEWIKTFLAQYKNGGMLPVWELAGNETFCMIGYHSVPVIVDAWQKGIRNFDPDLALEAMQSYAESKRFGLPDYREKGYLSNDREHESVSKTLEYAYDDWCIAQFARMNSNLSVYKTYIQRAQYYKNLFDPETHHMRGKIQASWYRPFDPREINNFYTEGNSWQYTFAVPQDINGLIRLHGGEDAFAKKLEELFTTSSQTTGRQQSDVTGLIGQYAQGNEPSHHMAYLFNYVRMPWRTQELVQKICSEFYKNDPDGLIGNEDCGQMSAWYIFSAMGFYPVVPGSGEYVTGIPQFDEIKLNLENGKTFLIRATNRMPGMNYVSSIKLNGRESRRTYLRHTDLAYGGSLEFVLAGSPDKVEMGKYHEPPRAQITGDQIVPVPYFNVPVNKFHDRMEVQLAQIDSSTIMYAFVQPATGINQPEKEYKGPFRIDSSCTMRAYAIRDGIKSQVVVQDFFKLPSDKSISVLSKVHPMYTAGGPEALIDGIMGNANWRTGNWQSYFDQDFEAIIDLQKERPVHYAGIHVLQDVSPWILFPKELIISSSSDGKNFNEIGRIENREAPKPDSVQTMNLGQSFQNLQARYLKIRAVNGGKLPAWHESAGNPSHLFIDEVIVN
jgi:predicted alpha-1,2-mannosidase